MIMVAVDEIPSYTLDWKWVAIVKGERSCRENNLLRKDETMHSVAEVTSSLTYCLQLRCKAIRYVVIKISPLPPATNEIFYRILDLEGLLLTHQI